jgi:hypothetical protein
MAGIRSRLLRIAALGAIVAVGGYAGTAAAKQDASSPLQQAAAATAAANSSQFAFSLSISGVTGLPTAGGKIMLTGSGGSDTKHKTAAIHLNLGALAASLGALTKGAKVPSTIDILVVHNVLYVHLPALAAQISPGKEWLKLDPSTLPKSTTGGANVGKIASSIDQKKVLAALQSAVSVKPVGTAVIRGTPTTHYAGTLQLSALSAVLPADQRAAFAKGLAQIGIKTVPFDVYIDGHHLIRRFATQVANLKAQGAGAAVSLSATIDLFGFGKKLVVHAPPASKTADAGKLLGSLAGGIGGGSGGGSG